MKTDYILHDRQYQKRRAGGKLGWTDADVLADNNVKLGATLAAGYYPKSGRVLELGCGAGDLSLELARRGYEVSGIDIAPTAIEWAHDKARECGLSADFQVGSVLDLANYADDSFDLVLDGYCLHCIIGDDRPKFYAAARRVLKPNGLLHINTMWADAALADSLPGYDPATRCQIWNGVALRYFGLPDELLTEVTVAGFEIVHSEVCPRPRPDHSAMLLIDARKPLG
jgi:SAM-dependent methyltransferase